VEKPRISFKNHNEEDSIKVVENLQEDNFVPEIKFEQEKCSK